MIEIIPATDIIDGACVRLTQGDYASRKTYYRDPLEAALRFEEAGIRRLHMVDLDGAKASEPRNLAVLERIAAGQSAEAATAEFLTDDYFEAWYQATLAQLQQYEG